MTFTISAPTSEEFADFYAGYIQRAMQRDDLYTALSLQVEEIRTAMDSLTEVQACYRPGPAEWSIKEVMGHLNDGERVFSYRLLRISRNDPTPLPGFEQDDFVRAAGFDSMPLGDLI